jgi:hypothetical protein
MRELKMHLMVSCVAIVVLASLSAQSGAAVIGEWKLNDNPVVWGGTCADASGLRNLTYTNAYHDQGPNFHAYSTTGRWGVANTAVHFGGSPDVATSAPDYGASDPNTWPAYNLPSYSVEGFFMRDDTSTTQQFFYSEASWGGPLLFLGVQNNAVSFGVYDSLGWTQMIAPAALEPAKWYYTAAVVDSNKVPTLYMYDGATMQSWTGPTLGTPVLPNEGYYLTVGAGISRAGWGFLGTVDNVTVYDTALDAATLLLHATTDTDHTQTFLPGDADRNGTVDGADLNTVLSNYNQTFTVDPWSMGDFDGNGTVDGADLNTVLSNYNQHLAAAGAPGTPEPSTLLLAAAGLVGLLCYAWRKEGISMK